jgi:hypothetical protein
MNIMIVRNRIKKHVRVRAGDLVPHEMNPRLHTAEQRAALQALYEQIGFARSLLAYELPDGRLKLIDGHLRRDLGPDMEVEVEVLDVGDDEARALLLSLDPLAALADYDEMALEQLRATTETDSEALQALWATLEARDRAARERLEKTGAAPQDIPEQYLVLVECGSEADQVALLQRLTSEGLRCRALNA